MIEDDDDGDYAQEKETKKKIILVREDIKRRTFVQIVTVDVLI
jgi:hypothetical protein